MAQRKVVVTRDIPQAGITRLQSCSDVAVDVHRQTGAIERSELLTSIRGAAALLCLLSDPIDGEVMDAAPELKIIANYAVGYDNIDVEAASQRGIWVTNTPGVLTDATADLAMALLLAAARRIVEADRYTRQGSFIGWAPKLLLGKDLHGATLGIIGMGRIGQALARRARAFSMKVVYHNRRPVDDDIERSLAASRLELDELLRQSDFVSLHVPGGEATKGMIGARELAMMKDDAVLVNTARGTVVDEGALVEALTKGAIRAAGLDVFEEEPTVHPGLLTLDNVVIAPHIGSATDGTRSKMAEMAAANILAVLGGLEPPNAVNEPAS